MFSAIVGDIAGSRWEGCGIKLRPDELITSSCTFTDDTICTLAVMRWLLDGKEAHPGRFLRELGLEHMDKGFGQRMMGWLRTPNAGTMDSWGNGAAMRVSPVAVWAQTHDEAMALAEASVHPTHVHPDSVIGAQATVWAIRHAFAHQNPHLLLQDASGKWPYGDLTLRDPVGERAAHRFDVSVQGTVPLALVCAARGHDLGDTCELAIAFGGDTDTLAAIAGGVAEGLYGLDPELGCQAARKAEWWYDIRMQQTVVEFLTHPRVQAFYSSHGRQAPDVGAWFAQGPDLAARTTPRRW